MCSGISNLQRIIPRASRHERSARPTQGHNRGRRKRAGKRACSSALLLQCPKPCQVYVGYSEGPQCPSKRTHWLSAGAAGLCQKRSFAVSLRFYL
jgi:hypothetical protein